LCIKNAVVFIFPFQGLLNIAAVSEMVGFENKATLGFKALNEKLNVD